MRTRVARLAFNRGLISRLGLARADIKRVALAAETMVNWMVRTLGSMMLRPGFGYLGNTSENERAFFIPFEFAIDDTALVELTDGVIRVWVDDAVVTRPAVGTLILNGGFDANLNNWTDADEVGATSDWSATGGVDIFGVAVAGVMRMVGNGTAFAIRRQQLTIAAADQNVVHGLRIDVSNGPVLLRIGSTSGTDDLFNETALGTGEHHLAFIPTGASAWIEFKSRLQRYVYIEACDMQQGINMIGNAPWLTVDQQLLRYDQSGDIIYVACAKTTDRIGYQPFMIQRRNNNSWSVVRYQPEDGPFRAENVSTTTLAASAITGNITLTASAPLFRAGHVGALFQLVSVGQQVIESITAQNVFSDEIRISGVTTSRIFTVIRSGLSGTGNTVTLQRSLDEPGNWEDVTTYTTDATISYDDGLDNQIVYYRIGIKTGDFVMGVTVVTLQIGIGSITGAVRITAVSTSVSATAEVLVDLGSTEATDIWSEGAWSDYRGWPTSVAFHEGRLGWAGRNKVDLSISDAFDGFDPDFEGDAGPIQRSIANGPVDTINWMLSLQRLILGGQAAEHSARSSSLDEPLTATNFNLKAASTQGSNAVAAVKVDKNGVFVQRGGVRVFELSFGADGIDYDSTQLSALIPEIGEPGIEKILVQRQPDTRLHFIRSDGTVAVLVFDKVEQVICWLEIETDGEIEDGAVLPAQVGDSEDYVYYCVKRTIGGVVKRFLEKWAFEDECRGDAQLCKLADSFVAYTGVATTTITAAHLAGQEVVVWADGADVGTDSDGEQTYTLDGSGLATLPTAVTNYVVGLPYSSSFKSAKFVELMDNPGGSLLDHQRVTSLGLIMADVHAKGLKYGFSLTESEMRDLPEIEEGTAVDADAVRVDYAMEPFAPPGGWSTDTRLCLLGKAPRPVTVLAAIAKVEHHG